MNEVKDINEFAYILDLARKICNGTDADREEDVKFIISSMCNVTKKQHQKKKIAYRARERTFACMQLQDLSCTEALEIYNQCFKEESHKEEEFITNDSLFYTYIGAENEI